MSEDMIKALMTFYITMVTQVINQIDPQVGALFSATAALMVVLVITRRKED